MNQKTKQKHLNVGTVLVGRIEVLEERLERVGMKVIRMHYIHMGNSQRIDLISEKRKSKRNIPRILPCWHLLLRCLPVYPVLPPLPVSPSHLIEHFVLLNT